MQAKEKGVALILAISVVTVISILLTGYVAVTISERNRAQHNVAGGAAYYIAQAGAEQVFFDLAAEIDKDGDWSDDHRINQRIINDSNNDGALDSGAGEGMPDPTSSGSFESSSPPQQRSKYVPFYSNVSFGGGSSAGAYDVDIAFVTDGPDSCPGSSCKFRPNLLWVRAKGVHQSGETITLKHLANGRKSVKNQTLTILYNSLDRNNTRPDSAVDTAAANSVPNELRIATAKIDEPVTININDISMSSSVDMTIFGGYGPDFNNGSRNPASNISLLKNSRGGAVVTISGSGTVIMGGIRIE
ncbi:MAG: hypothetical protein ACE5GG_00765 [Candidatus Omnitrophota bacterium]